MLCIQVCTPVVAWSKKVFLRQEEWNEVEEFVGRRRGKTLQWVGMSAHGGG